MTTTMACHSGKRQTAHHNRCARWTFTGRLCRCPHHTAPPDQVDAARWTTMMRAAGVEVDQLPALEGVQGA